MKKKYFEPILELETDVVQDVLMASMDPAGLDLPYWDGIGY